MDYKVTKKGLALLAAIETGLVPKSEDGYEIGSFSKFWEAYENLLAENAKKPFSKQSQNKSYKRRNNAEYLKFCLLAAFGFALGLILQKAFSVLG